MARCEPWVSIAAYNGPESVVISGRLQEVERDQRAVWRQACAVERLRVSHAFHSPLMEEVAAEFAGEDAVAVRFFGTAGDADLDGDGRRGEAWRKRARREYWRRQVRDAVRFHEAMQSLAAQGCRAFVEIGPGSTLLGMGQELHRR